MKAIMNTKFKLNTNKAESEVRERLLQDGIVKAERLAITSTAGVEELVTNNYYTYKTTDGFWLLVPAKYYEEFIKNVCFADDFEYEEYENY